MKLQLQFEKENDIPFYFRCQKCKKVPKRFLIDVDRSWIFCLKCFYLVQHSQDTQYSPSTQIEQNIINTISVKCQTCKQFIFANQLRRHQKLCINQITLYHQICLQTFISCKYCQLDCRCNFTNQLINVNQLPEQILQMKLREFFICQFCFKSINFFELQHHQTICQFYEIICDLCEDKFLRNTFIEHYYLCTSHKYTLMNQEKLISQQYITLLGQQQYLYQAQFNVAKLDKELIDLLLQEETDEEQQ
ncbi:hypothetical protein pb186bvf_008022 [Paramecium bursaria]